MSMPTSTVIQAVQNNDGVTQVKILLRHPMETGQRRDGDDQPIPINYIKSVWVEYKGKKVFSMAWGVSVSKDPTFAFKTTSVKKGDTATVFWQHHEGKIGQKDFVVE